MKFELESNHSVFLASLNQCRTYDFFMHGLPTEGMNEGIIERAVEAARKLSVEHEPYLVSPEGRPVKDGSNRPDLFGKAAQIPGIICTARLLSPKRARDRQADHSWLTVVWFQNTFALPIDESVFNRIKAIHWEEVAEDDYF